MSGAVSVTLYGRAKDREDRTVHLADRSGLRAVCGIRLERSTTAPILGRTCRACYDTDH